MHGLEVRGSFVDRGRFNTPGRFGRMFPHLRSLKRFEPGEEGLAVAMSKRGEGAESTIAAGMTFLAQFIDHDITFDPTSSLERQNDPEAIENFRTPALELDSVYGAGPDAQPYLYDPEHPGRLLIHRDGDLRDLPRMPARNGKEIAIIGDPRNDENLLISQLHLAFMRFHNAVRDAVDPHLDEKSAFEKAQTQVRWHYHWMILNEFLPTICGKRVVEEILGSGHRFFRFGKTAFMPVEFSVAAYRFGHSMVRGAYRMNAETVAPIFTTTGEASHLGGGRRLPGNLRVDWTLFFGDGAARSRRLDTKLALPLFDLPDSVVPKETRIDETTGQPVTNDAAAIIDFAIRNLAQRNLARAKAFSLPSGEAIARYMGIDPLDNVWDDIEGGEGETPLWFYILREADVLGGGNCLAGVGARIVAEVIVGLLESDLASFLNQAPRWKPSLGAQDGHFSIVDLVSIAENGVDGGLSAIP